MNTSSDTKQTERELITVSIEIGGIAEMASWATEELSVLIAGKGKPVGELTVSELMGILQKHQPCSVEKEKPVSHCLTQ
ncbi:MAG: hypothetical protein KDI49_08405 [Gammaproteobacteria bacterium]|nr:hypothetical protein [Gammaproteobacteria bacterium]MCP5443353.1 hypothetical protein [Chromatiaceae bacterium]